MQFDFLLMSDYFIRQAVIEIVFFVLLISYAGTASYSALAIRVIIDPYPAAHQRLIAIVALLS